MNIGSSSALTTTNGALTTTGLITANNSIKTAAIDPITSGGNFNIGNTVASTINVGTASATAVNIGSSGALTKTNGALTTTGLITANNGLTMGTGMNITLQPTAGVVAPTAFTQLGGTSTNKNAISLTIGAAIVVLPVQITRAGTYLFTCGSQITFTSAFTYFYSNIYESSTAQTVNTVAIAGTGMGVIQTQGNFGQQPVGTISGTQIMTTNGSYVYTVPETKANFYYSFVMYVLGGGTLGSLNSFMTITRLG